MKFAKYFALVLLCAALGIILWPPKNLAKTSSAKEEASAVGSIGSVSLSIPRGYIFFPITYKGEDIWSGKRIADKPTLETPISTASLIVRLPDMSPRSLETEAERAAAIKEHDLRKWVLVQIEGHGKDESPWAKAVAGRVRELSNSENWVGWHYEKVGVRFGLTEEVLVGATDENRKKNWVYDKNLMYDDGAWSTYIRCNTNELKHRARQRCTQSFSLKPKINAHVKVDYDSENLKDWKSIQEKLSALIYRFIDSEQHHESTTPTRIENYRPSHIPIPPENVFGQ